MKSRMLQIIFLFLTGIFVFSLSIGWMNKNNEIPNEIIREAVGKSIPVLQMSSNAFIVKKSCSSCHHGTLTSMAVELAKQKGVSVEDSFAITRKKAEARNLQLVSNPNIISDFL